MKAIQVKFMGATDKRGSQYKAFIQGNSVVAPSWRFNNDIEQDNRQEVAQMLMNKLAWDDCEISGGGAIPNGDYVFTIKDKS